MNSRSTIDSVPKQVRFGTHNAPDGAEFTYHLTFAQVPAGVAWRAIVRDPAGALTATPRGLVRNVRVDAADLDVHLHDAVAQAIDQHDGPVF